MKLVTVRAQVRMVLNPCGFPLFLPALQSHMWACLQFISQKNPQKPFGGEAVLDDLIVDMGTVWVSTQAT